MPHDKENMMHWQHMRFLTSVGLAIAFLMSVAATASTCIAGPLWYTDVGPVPPGITFTGISESSGTDAVPLYGAPEGFSVGLDFDPAGFVAVASGGASDITDGQLNFTVMGTVSPSYFVGVKSISLSEAGDYTLAGTGTATTQALAGAIARATVTQINGVDVTPFDLDVPGHASVSFNLAANPGIVEPWSLTMLLDIEGQLTAQGYGADQLATKVEVVIDNQLLAFSESGSMAFIAKKEFSLNVEPGREPVVPEPGTWAPMLIGLAGLAFVRRYRQ